MTTYRQLVRSVVSTVTRSGWTLGALSAGSLLTGYLASYPVLLPFGLAGAILCGFAVLALFLRPTLEVERSIDPPRVTVGDIALGTVIVSNNSRRPSMAQNGRDRVGLREIQVMLPGLLPGKRKVHRYALPTDRRSALKVGPFVVAQADPFGLMVRERNHGQSLDFYVHPRRYELTRLPASRRLSLDGPTSDRAPRGSTTFHAIRQYVPGDDRRHIHWKVSARTGELMVRQFVDTSEPSLVLVVDLGVDRYSDPGHFESAVEIVASLAEAASNVRFPVRVVTTNGDAWAAKHDEPDVLLDRLAGVELCEGGSLDKVAHELLAGPRGPTLMLIGGRFDPSDLGAVESMRSHFEDTSMISVGEMGSSLGPGHSLIVDGAQFAAMWNGEAMR